MCASAQIMLKIKDLVQNEIFCNLGDDAGSCQTVQPF